MQKHSGQLLLLRSAGQPKQNNVGCRDTDALELQPLRESPFRTQRITVRAKLGAPRRPSSSGNMGAIPHLQQTDALEFHLRQQSGQCWRSQSESWRDGIVSRLWHLPRPLPSPGKVMDEDVSSEQGSGGQVDGANNGSLTCQDDVPSTTRGPTLLEKVRGNRLGTEHNQQRYRSTGRVMEPPRR